MFHRGFVRQDLIASHVRRYESSGEHLGERGELVSQRMYDSTAKGFGSLKKQFQNFALATSGRNWYRWAEIEGCRVCGDGESSAYEGI